MATSDKKLIQITGRVIERKTKQGLSNLRVEAWDKDLIFKDAVGAATTDQQGAFVIELAKGQFKDLFADRHVSLFFKVFRDDQLIISTEGSVLWDRDAPDSEIVIKVSIDSPKPTETASTGQSFTVNGQVRRADGSVFKDGFVQAFVAIQGQQTMLGETKTDPNGQFEIAYTLDASQVSQLANVRVFVRVLDSNRAQLTESPSFIPDEVVTVNLTIPNPPPPVEPLLVNGQVRGKDGIPIAKATVRAFITTPEKETLLGEARTDSNGNYVITATVQSLATPPAGALLESRVFDKQATLLGRLSSPIQKGVTTMNVVVELPGEEQCVVSGQVFQKDGKPLSSGIVRVYGAVPTQRALDKASATITAADDGRFRIEYQPAEFSPRISEANRIEVRVFRVVNNREQELVQSPSTPVQFRADAEQSLNIHLGDDIVVPPDPTKTLKVSGLITEDHAPLPDAIVRAFNNNLSGALLGATHSSHQTSDKGRYEITYTVGPAPSTISRDPDLVIAVFTVVNDQETLRKASAVVPSAGKDQTIDVDIPVIVVPPDPGGDITYTVVGTVTSPDRAGVNGLRVQIVDKNVGPDVFLAQTVTKEDGSYTVSFVVKSLGQRCKQKPDLQARAYAGEILLAASEVRYFASTLETLNVTLPANSAALPSEYETLIGSLAAHCGGRLSDLKESDDRQDITYLANKTGWDARAVALAALAHQFSQRASNTALAPFLFYALFRAGLPTDEATIYHADSGTLTTVWNNAVEQGVIPKSATGLIPQAIAQFQIISAQKLMTGPALIGASSLKDMLVSSGLNSTQQTKFAELYAANRSDIPKLWDAVSNAFGSTTANRLQVDGKLGFLTINNAPLMQAIHTAAGAGGVTDPLQLAQLGYHSASKWNDRLTSSIPIPPEIPGDTDAAKRANYAEYLAGQVRLSYPTACVAQMIKSGDLPLGVTSADVHDFLSAHQDKFDIGRQPVQQFIKRNNLTVSPDTVTQVARLQRVLQITPGDQAMNGLLKVGIDAAYHVVGFEKEEFIQLYQKDVGGTASAAQVYDKSVQVHNATLHIAISYLSAANGLGLGAARLQNAPSGSDAPGQVIQPAPRGPTAGSTADVIAYPTLEGLFGEMDFCECDHCRSVLSPAAYLVDLLLFLDRTDQGWASYVAQWKLDHGNAPYPFANLAAWNTAGHPLDTETTPLQVLLSRRPDLEHLPLTCENTNTALPYIDVVNETLEYFVANQSPPLSLTDYVGHDTDGSGSADLLASPQFVMDSAYTILRGERFPVPLPFHQPLETLRRYFEKFDVSLPLAMERLRKSNDLERGTNPYGWRDILMEELRLSRDEHEILTDSNAVPLWRTFGFPNGTSDAIVIAGLSNAKGFTRSVGITYEEIVAILETRFVNPNSDLIPRLERLGVPFAELKKLKDTNTPAANAAFDALLPTGTMAPDPGAYGGDIKAWVRNDANFARIMSLITLTDPTGNPDPCNFDNLEFRFSRPMANTTDTSTRLSAVEFFRLMRFIRLWKKMGWTIEQTDDAICALYRTDLQPLGADDVISLSKLDAGFLTLLPRLAIAGGVMHALNLTPRRDLSALLACWSDIGTHGDGGLYRQMFLNPAILNQDAVFADNGFGEFLQKADVSYTHSQATLEQPIGNAAPGLSYDHVNKRLSYPGILNIATRDALKNVAGVSPAFKLAIDALYAAQRIFTHAEALRAAFNLTGDEFDRIVAALEYDAGTELSIPNISAIFRRGYLARKLKLSVRELLLLTSLTGLDPFAAPDVTDPAILQLIALIQAMKARSLKSAAALYLIWNQDLSGKSAPGPARIASFARTLRLDFAAVETEFAIKDDPDGAIAQARMSLVYGADAAAFFFGLLNDTLTTNAPYSRSPVTLTSGIPYDHGQPTLEQVILDAAPGLIAYDAANKQLSFAGSMTAATRDKLKAVTGVTNDFKDAVDNLYAESQRVINANLEQAIVDVAPARIVYDDFRKLLSYAGVLTETTRDKLLGAAALAVTPQQSLNDFNTAMADLYLENQKSINPFFARYPELKAFYDVHASESAATRRSALLNEILPDLLKQRKSQQALQAMSAAAQTDLDFARALLDTSVRGNALHAAEDRNKPALDDLLALETQGLSVRFFANDTASGTVIPFADIAAKLDYAPMVKGVGNPLPANPTPHAAISGIWSGYLEAPESGFFNLLIEADLGATVTLKLEDDDKSLTQTAAQTVTLWENRDRVELRAGALYAIELKVEKVRDSVRVQWDWEPKGGGRTVIPPRYLYPVATLPRFQQVYIRFLKASALATSLGMTASEMAHFGTHADYRINSQGQSDSSGEGWLNVLPNVDNLHLTNPTQAAIAKTLNATLLTVLRDLLDYARIKAEISPGDETLLEVLEDPTGATASADSSLFTMTRWDRTSLNNLLAQFGGNIAGLSRFNQFRRVYDAFALIQKMGISASALIEATTNEPGGDTVRDLQAALRARYDAAAWRDVVQPINDAMRSVQRDALMAYILHQMRSNLGTSHIDTADKLFEYFLMDVQMEPCMQTSRIRHALSSAQLFIERCLMNLEPRVYSGAINAKQWEWMKRYRVWEANRKVFLFPENWLEPELRDDKSPFFKEIESELLQSDITEDSAAEALLNYLSKLEEVAKLEPCGIYHMPADQAMRTGEIDHIIARTAGAHRKYYYRRFEFGYWTPWEQIKLDIEDNPVIPHVWNGRLLLFWLRILKRAPLDPNAAPDTTAPNQIVNNLGLGDIKRDAKTAAKADVLVTVQAVLCWSEYYNGKWQPARTSDVSNPALIGQFNPAGSGAFKRSDLRLSAIEDRDTDTLQVSDLASGALFLLYNTHSLPVTGSQGLVVVGGPRMKIRDLNTSAAPFVITNGLVSTTLGFGPMGRSVAPEPLTTRRAVLTNQITDRTIAPTHRLANIWDAPFFYEDSRHVFFVTVTERAVRIPDHPNFGFVFNPRVYATSKLPPLIFQTQPPVPARPVLLRDGDSTSTDVGSINPGAIERFVTEDAYIHRGLGATGSVTYGASQIGPTGRMPGAGGQTSGQI